MQSVLRRSLFAPLHYWRTLALVLIVALAVTRIFQDVIAVLLSSVACAFVFRHHENRRWLVMSTEGLIGDIALRLLVAFTTASTVYGASLTAIN